MTSSSDFELIHGQLHVTNTASKPEPLGRGPAAIRGATYMQGPTQVGNDSDFSNVDATMIIGKLNNGDVKSSPLYSLWVKLYSRFQNFVRIDTLLKVKFIEAKIVRTKILQASIKNFVIDHPTKEGKKLVHTCLEGPENGVYIRGTLRNKDIIELPEYWTNLIDESTITVSITPVGSHQDIIVKGISDNKVYLQARPGIPINCYYHIFATRKDVPKLITEID